MKTKINTKNLHADAISSANFEENRESSTGRVTSFRNSSLELRKKFYKVK